MFGSVDKMKPITMGGHDDADNDAPVTRQEFDALVARVAALEGEDQGEEENSMPMKPMMGKGMMK